MNIKFHNLGKIRETELDLRPLTVIIGPNNSNKTYIAYSVYALWEWLGSGESPIFKADSHAIREWLERNGIPLFEPKDEFSLPVDIIVRILSEAYRKEHITLNLEKFFQDSSHKLFADANLEIELSVKEEIGKIFARGKQISSDDSFLFETKEELLFVRPNDIKENHISRSYPMPSGLEGVTAKGVSDSELFFLADISGLLFPVPLAFPAERNALILTYKLLSNRRYKLMKDILGNRNFNRRQAEMLKGQRYPKPIEDFLDFLTDVEMAKEPDTDQEFQKLADDIEQHIQNRNKICLEPMNLGGNEIRVRVKNGLDIDLHNASSAIRQLVPLLLYLRYRVRKNDFLIIDEPEMNLHPESQTKLLEAFGIMVNLGVRILITTHSPYLLDHLNSLVSGTVGDPEILKGQAESLYMKDPLAFLSTDQVSAYEMRGNKLLSLKDEDYGIRWDTLGDVSSDIQQKYFELCPS
ncbi:AAA family ATPase [Desulfobacterales bacterium HSG2]|nr:AAA family ATPase [Desulfobacterales bacterium HSG2]